MSWQTPLRARPGVLAWPCTLVEPDRYFISSQTSWQTFAGEVAGALGPVGQPRDEIAQLVVGPHPVVDHQRLAEPVRDLGRAELVPGQPAGGCGGRLTCTVEVAVT